MLWSKGQIPVSLWIYSRKCHVPRGNHSQGSWESSWEAGACGPAGTWNARGLPNSWSRGWSQFPFSSLLQAPVPEPSQPLYFWSYQFTKESFAILH